MQSGVMVRRDTDRSEWVRPCPSGLPAVPEPVRRQAAARPCGRSIHRIKILLFRPAFRTDPGVRQVGKGGARLDIVFIIAFGRIIDVATGAFHFLHGVSPSVKVKVSRPAVPAGKGAGAGARERPFSGPRIVSAPPRGNKRKLRPAAAGHPCRGPAGSLFRIVPFRYLALDNRLENRVYSLFVH